MKGISFFLGIFILFLSCLPCQDSHAIFPQETSISHAELPHEHVDFCSPFCSCTCCVTQAFSFSYLPEIPNFTQPELFSNQPLAFKKESFPIQTLNEIWQPPRI